MPDSNTSRKVETKGKHALSLNFLKICKDTVLEVGTDCKQYEMTITRCGRDSKCTEYGDRNKKVYVGRKHNSDCEILKKVSLWSKTSKLLMFDDKIDWKITNALLILWWIYTN